jgi:hypothetical protein
MNANTLRARLLLEPSLPSGEEIAAAITRTFKLPCKSLALPGSHLPVWGIPPLRFATNPYQRDRKTEKYGNDVYLRVFRRALSLA